MTHLLHAGAPSCSRDERQPDGKPQGDIGPVWVLHGYAGAVPGEARQLGRTRGRVQDVAQRHAHSCPVDHVLHIPRAQRSRLAHALIKTRLGLEQHAHEDGGVHWDGLWANELAGLGTVQLLGERPGAVDGLEEVLAPRVHGVQLDLHPNVALGMQPLAGDHLVVVGVWRRLKAAANELQLVEHGYDVLDRALPRPLVHVVLVVGDRRVQGTEHVGRLHGQHPWTSCGRLRDACRSQARLQLPQFLVALQQLL